MVTDRTQADLDLWRDLQKKGYAAMTDAEKELWDSGIMKGAYNASDLNRVGEALNYLLEALANIGEISRDAFVAKTDWDVTDIPTAEELSAYLSYVAIIRSATEHFANTPLVPADTGTLNYSGANDIEKILLDAELVLHNVQDALFFSDDLYCGEV